MINARNRKITKRKLGSSYHLANMDEDALSIRPFRGFLADEGRVGDAIVNLVGPGIAKHNTMRAKARLYNWRRMDLPGRALAVLGTPYEMKIYTQQLMCNLGAPRDEWADLRVCPVEGTPDTKLNVSFSTF